MLAQEHQEVLARLPATVHAFILVELQKWPTLFDPEQRYQRALLEYLSSFSRSELVQVVADIANVEADAECNTIARGDPARFQEAAQLLLRKRKLVAPWRKAVDAFFQNIDPAIEARLHPADAPRRLVVQLYGSGIAIQPEKLWSRFNGIGIRVPLQLEGTHGNEAFVRSLFGAREGNGTAPALFSAARDSAGFAPLDAWIIESHETLHQLCDDRTSVRASASLLTGLSYDRLRGYRDNLMRELYARIQSGVESPRAFADYARSLKIAPEDGALLNSDGVVHAFVREVFLTGNGTLFVNNTFVEWAAVQALRRAQPRMLVTRFGVRDKLRPFSSMLLFSQPRTSDQMPSVADPAGSFIDVEQLAYYVWLNAEKSAAYRTRTLYLFLAEGSAEMLAIRSDAPGASAPVVPPVTLSDVCVTMAQWLGVPLREPSGRAIAPLCC